MYLLENLNGERRPELSRAAHPNALTGCWVSADFSITTTKKESQNWTKCNTSLAFLFSSKLKPVYIDLMSQDCCKLTSTDVVFGWDE